MKIKHEFKSRKEAVAYLEQRGWMTSTIFPATGMVVLSSNTSNSSHAWAIAGNFENPRNWVLRVMFGYFQA